eukprot:PhM_4_TR11098/c0_g1_i1/m.42844/K20303/TRAPPC4, TRS23; trafficking protein particle complex subunit 4
MEPPSRIYFIWLINKSGTLMYSRDFAPIGITSSTTTTSTGSSPTTAAPISENQRITLASIIHGLLELSKGMSPVHGSGPMEIMDCTDFTLHVHSTLTELKFVVCTHTSVSRAETLMLDLYKAYVDYVLKNPFYSLDQTVRMPMFSTEVDRIVASFSRKV